MEKRIAVIHETCKGSRLFCSASIAVSTSVWSRQDEVIGLFSILPFHSILPFVDVKTPYCERDMVAFFYVSLLFYGSLSCWSVEGICIVPHLLMFLTFRCKLLVNWSA
jgi:hypothetical protein